jgi:hypothetical protein
MLSVQYLFSVHFRIGSKSNPEAKANLFSISYGPTKSRALIQKHEFSRSLLSPDLPKQRVELDALATRAKALNRCTERSRGFENPLPRTERLKVRGWHNSDFFRSLKSRALIQNMSFSQPL